MLVSTCSSSRSNAAGDLDLRSFPLLSGESLILFFIPFPNTASEVPSQLL